jgi:hypothetical protein
MARFEGRTLKDLQTGTEPGDLLVNERGRPILIQVAEVVDPVMRMQYERRQEWREALSSPARNLLPLFQGCRITLTDDSDKDRPLPQLKTNAGRTSLKNLTEQLRTFGAGLSTLLVGMSRSHWMTVDGVTVVVSADRRDTAAQASIWWSGGRPYVSGEDMNHVTTTLRGKLVRHYAKPDAAFWLLLYSCDVFLKEDDKVQAQALLGPTRHPFDEVWYLFPYPNQELGHLVLIWDSAARRE